MQIERKLYSEKLVTPLMVIGLLLGSLLFSVLIVKVGAIAGFLALGVLVGLPFVIGSVANVRFGFVLAVVFAFFMFHLKRILPGTLPTGTILDLIIACAFLGVILVPGKNSKKNWESLKNPHAYVYAVWLAYWVIQVANPFAAGIGGWLFSARGTLVNAMLYVVVMHVFSSKKYIFTFTKIWLGLALLVALYGFWQEFVGLSDWEMEWLKADEERFNLVYIWGRFRKWSFLSDVSAFGMFMTYSGIVCIIMALGPFKSWQRAVLMFSGVIMFFSMNFSGTRTAIAMIPAGLSLYALMTINQKRTIILVSVSAAAFLILLFGPFYGGNAQRFRSTFFPEDDPSMLVRERNRAFIQPYIWSHPIGGGVTTTGPAGEMYQPGHQLAGFPPDNGYLETALEKGPIGLLLTMALFITSLIIGIRAYYRSENPITRYLLAAYLAAFFAMAVGNYAQTAMFQKPGGLILFAYYAIIVRMAQFDKEEREQGEQSVAHEVEE
ncbi:O-antigen ligase family protein [Roseivirga sp. BDSF3-8]|uniref:O-antigen ligase family protein n=1 Tax=Roseivirga sp. BDSF3-8 TaxID=3241598 RepID=UPI00353210FD